MLRLSQLVPDWNWSRTAIISRDWQKLMPVRDFADALGIPIDMADERTPGLWRMREMQMFIDALKADRTRVVSVADLTGMLNTIPTSRWTDQIGIGIGILAREINGRSLPVPDVIEWFAEWARETWGEQTGLKLLTAHRAKGLEFDDVIILDGGWERPSRNEDQDAPRRLFYVAMTRARRNLVVMSNDNHEYLPQSSASVVIRNSKPDMRGIPQPRRCFQFGEARMVDLSFAGRLPANHPALSAIADARIGDSVSLQSENGRWVLKDASGRTLSRMSKNFSPPPSTTFASVSITAILRWRKDDADEKYHYTLKRDVWEVVVPDLVFEAADTPSGTSYKQSLAGQTNDKRTGEGHADLRRQDQKPAQPTAVAEAWLDDLRTKLSAAVKKARSWSDLQAELGQTGLQPAPRGGGLVVKSASTDEALCEASELGFGYAKLIKKFRSGFPGHSHTWIAERILQQGDR